jgi:proteic killer suppression protein
MSVAKKEHGEHMAEKIDQRIGEIRAADSVEQMVQFKIGGCHPLHHDRKGQYAVYLVHPYRLIFEQKDNTIQIVTINEIVDYH